MLMLEFFRRYQRAFFIVITVVIVISFSFFGTFQTFSGSEQDDSVAFTALDGSKVRRSEVSDMVTFLTTDSHDFLFFWRLQAMLKRWRACDGCARKWSCCGYSCSLSY